MTFPFDRRVMIITTLEDDKKTGRKRLVSSNGVRMDTGNNVTLPCEHPADLGAVYDESLREWMLSAPHG